MNSDIKKIILGAIPFYLLLIALYIIYLGTPISKRNIVDVTVEKGTAFIPGDRAALFSLRGEFTFTPNRFSVLKNPDRETYGKIPGTFLHTEMNSKFGYGSYGLEISGLDPDVIYAMQVAHALSSCSIIINGKEADSQGKPGIDKATELPGTKFSETVFRPLPDGTATMIFNVSNFRNTKGGITGAIILGESSKLAERIRGDFIFAGCIFAVTFSVAIFFFLLSFFISNPRLLFGLRLHPCRWLFAESFFIRILCLLFSEFILVR